MASLPAGPKHGADKMKLYKIIGRFGRFLFKLRLVAYFGVATRDKSKMQPRPTLSLLRLSSLSFVFDEDFEKCARNRETS